MRNIYGFVNLFGAPELGALTEKRNFGSVSFLGRYGLIDFALSNFANSNIGRVGVLVDRYSNSIRSHLRNGTAFTVNTKTGHISVLFDEDAAYQKDNVTDISTINATRDHFEERLNDYIVIAPAYILMSMDFNTIVDAHIKSGLDVTLVYEHRFDLDKEMKGMNLLTIKNRLVKNMKRNDLKEKEGDVSLDVFVMNRSYFEYIISTQKDVSDKYNLRDMIKYDIKNNKKEAFSYEFKGFTLPILSLQNYIDGSFFLLPYLNRLKIFKEDWPIYTATHNTPPTKYGPKANVKNSFVANGSIINGTVENSIISRNVNIEAGAVVKNSIIFTSSEIKKGANLNYVLTDKSVYVGEKVSVSGNKKEYYIIKQGEKL